MSTATEASPAPRPVMLSTGEFAERLKCAAKSVVTWCEAGLIPPEFVEFTEGGHRRISVLALPAEVRRPCLVFTTSEVAAMFKVSQMTVKNWRRAEQLKGFQTPGGHWRYTDENVNEYAVMKYGRVIISYVKYRQI